MVGSGSKFQLDTDESLSKFRDNSDIDPLTKNPRRVRILKCRKGSVKKSVSRKCSLGKGGKAVAERSESD